MNTLPRVAAGGLATIAMLLFPVAAFAQEAPPGPTVPVEVADGNGKADEADTKRGILDGGGNGQDKPKAAKLKLKLKGLKKGKVKVGDRVNAIVNVRPFVPGQRAMIKLGNRGKTVKKKTPLIRRVKGKNMGRFHLRSEKLIKGGEYRVRAYKRPSKAQEGGKAKSRKFKIRYPDLDPGQNNSSVALFNDLLKKQGYYTSGGSKYSSRTGRAVMAFRKVNGMARTFQATPGIFAKLAAGKGAFKLKYPGAGRHVEVDISKQVMVLADKGKPVHTFHVSTGAAATPSDQGGYTFYRRDPGYNSIGMYYSVYYNRGEAIHGYKSVPPYPASHGCIRNPIPDSRFIYNWVSLGMKIWVYR